MSAGRMIIVGLSLLSMSSVWAATATKGANAYGEGMQAYMEEDYERAIAMFDSALRENATNAATLCFRAECFLFLAKNRDALSASDAALKLFPDCRMLLLIKAWCLQALSNSVRAEELVKEVMTGSPKELDWLGFFAQGRQSRILGRRQKAIEAFTQALKANPNDPILLNHRGMAYDNDGQIDAALLDYDAAIKGCASFYPVFMNRATLYKNIGNNEDALRDVQFVVDHKASGFAQYYLRGTIYQAMNKHSEALADFNRVLKEKPDYALAVYMRSVSFMRKADFASGRSGLKQYLELDPLGPAAKNAREALRLLDEQGL